MKTDINTTTTTKDYVESIRDLQRKKEFEELRHKREENQRQAQHLIPNNTMKQNNTSDDDEKNEYIDTKSKLTQILVVADEDIKSYYHIS